MGVKNSWSPRFDHVESKGAAFKACKDACFSNLSSSSWLSSYLIVMLFCFFWLRSMLHMIYELPVKQGNMHSKQLDSLSFQQTLSNIVEHKVLCAMRIWHFCCMQFILNDVGQVLAGFWWIGSESILVSLPTLFITTHRALATLRVLLSKVLWIACSLATVVRSVGYMVPAHTASVQISEPEMHAP